MLLAAGAVDLDADVILDHGAERGAPRTLALAPFLLGLRRRIDAAGDQFKPLAGLAARRLQRDLAVLPQAAPRRIRRPRIAGNEDEAFDAARHNAQP